MKVISASLQQSFEADVSTICRIITLTLKNGTMLRYTDLDRPIKLGLNTYVSAGVDASAVRQSSIGGGSGSNLRLVLGNENDITEEMIRSRALSGAKYVLECLDYSHPEYGTMMLGVGRFGSIRFNERGECDIDLNGLIQSGVHSIGEVYSQECRNDFGDKHCRYDVESLRVDFVIDDVLDYQSFQANELVGPIDKWLNGVVTFLDGDNAGTLIEVVASEADGTIDLALPTPYAILPGTAATIVPGCTKQRSQCKAYENLLNYRGEPDVPTVDEQNAPVAIDASATQPPGNPEILTDYPKYRGTAVTSINGEPV